ncbi:MAG: hypothetical protein IJV25_03150 [Prevotella sp.]|nr:hypothetical protein [Prevotella sp.]
MKSDRNINHNSDFGFKEPFEQAEIARYSDSERRQYYESQKEYCDYYSTMTTSYNKGHAEGHAEGLAEGRLEGINEANRENARRMKADGMTVEQVAKYTNLSIKEIEKL